MKNQEPKKEHPDDLPAFVEAYFSHLQFAPHVPKEFQTFLKSHLNAFALNMRAKYRPPIIVPSETINHLTAKEIENMSTPGETAFIQSRNKSFQHACVKGIAEIRAIISEYIVPDSGISAHKAMNEIIGITDNENIIPITPPTPTDENGFPRQDVENSEKSFDQIFEEEMQARGGA